MDQQNSHKTLIGVHYIIIMNVHVPVLWYTCILYILLHTLK